MNKIKKTLFVILYTLIAIFIIGEVLVRFMAPQETFSKAFLHSDKCYEKSDVTPFTLKKNYACVLQNRLGDFNITATINSDGYRGDEISSIKAENTKRMIVLGDSFAFGYGVEDDQTIPVNIEKLFNEKGLSYEVINAGFSAGFSPDSYYAYLKDRGLKLDPDVVVLLYFPFNDVTDQMETVWNEVDDQGLPTSVASKDRVVDQGIFRYINTTVEYKYPILRESHLFHWFINTTRKKFNLFKRQQFPTDGSYRVGCILDPLCIEVLLKDEEQQVYRVMEGIQRLSEQHGFEFFVVVIPTDYQLYPESFTKYKNTRQIDPRRPDFYQKRFGAIISKMGVRYLDLYPVFDHTRDRGYPFFAQDAHFNDIGTSITAEAIVEYIDNGYEIKKDVTEEEDGKDDASESGKVLE